MRKKERLGVITAFIHPFIYSFSNDMAMFCEQIPVLNTRNKG